MYETAADIPNGISAFLLYQLRRERYGQDKRREL